MEPQRRSIVLSASVEPSFIEGTIESKADGDADSGTDALLWFSYDVGSYSDAPASPQNLPCVTVVNYEGQAPADIRHDGQHLLYPIPADPNYAEVGDNVYCVGFSPCTGWGNPDASAVSSACHVINGREDLMFADQMVGSYSKNFGIQTFRHLLTWVKINMNTTSLKAASVWGDIESLEVVSPDNFLSIVFSSTLEGGVPAESAVTYSGEPEVFLPVLPADRSLNVTIRMFAQVFCPPPASAAMDAAGKYQYLAEEQGELGYIIRVRTENIPQKEVFVKLKREDNVTEIESADYAVGKLFVVNLHFNEVAIVEGICTLRQWDDQNSDIYLN